MNHPLSATNPFGFTRSSVQRDHALICSDSHVLAPLPGAAGAVHAVTLIAPPLGNARFVQYHALFEGPGALPPLSPRRERVVYVLEGEVTVRTADAENKLMIGGFAYAPPPSGDGDPVQISLPEGGGMARVLVIEKNFVPMQPDGPVPRPIIGQEQEVAGKPFMGNEDAVLQVLLPDEPTFDMAVNIFTYQPGATLPFVEVHVMEHGMQMIAGMGIYRIGDSWYPVQDGDTIWMASYCPQWFVAMGKTPARYIYYKDVNRDPLESLR